MNGHISKKGGRYYVVLELGVDPATGKRRRKWHSGYKRKKDATDALHELVTDVRKGAYVEPTKETFGEYLARWLPTIRSTVRPNTYESYRGAVEGHLIPGLGTVALRQLDRTAFSTFYDELGRSGRKDGKGGLSPRSVRLVHVTAHKALDDAVRDNLLVRNPTEHAAVPGKSRSTTPSWTAEQVTAFLASVRGKRLEAAFVTLATTGLRRSELLGLRWSDVDLDGATLAVRQVVALDRYRPYFAQPKTARSRRVVALDAGTVKALRAHRRAQLEERVKAGPAWQGLDLVVCAEDGGILHPQTLSGAFERAAKAAGLPAIGIHGLRHSHASLGLAAGLPLVIMSERLGHSSTAITGDVYSHSLPAQHQAAADQVAGMILGGGA
jgi:integrase